MFFLLRVLIIFMGLFKFSSPVMAANFSSQMAAITNICTIEVCSAPYKREVIYDYTKSEVKSVLEKKLKSVAIEQAQIWADTILEGDYVTDYKTRLDRAEALFEDGKPVAFYLTYSEGAWDTSNCRYDGLNNSTLEGCKPGRIIESVYMSPDFSDYFFVEKDYAHFIENL